MGIDDWIESLRTRIREFGDILEADKELLQTFSEELEFHGYSVGRHVKLLQTGMLGADILARYRLLGPDGLD